jgi:Na+/H+ antiporter NhaD/arsenite permease-like protein
MDILVASAIFLISLGLIMSERINRTIVSVTGATAMVMAGLILSFYTEELVTEKIDFDTIGLLLGMMLLVAMLEPTGFFQYIAVKAGHLSRGNPWRLMLLLGLGTSVLSMFLSNVTTAILVAPVTILLAEILGVSPIPYLIAQALLSDTAGVATSIGDPASVLVASASGYTFNQFLTHSLPIIAVVILTSLALLRFLFREELSQKPPNAEAVLKLDAAEVLKDTLTMRRVLIVLALMIMAFGLQEPLGVSPAFIALTGAAVALIWIRPDINKVLEQVQWSVLIFFIGLFVMVGGLEETGTLDIIAHAISGLGNRPILLGIAIIWIVAGLSALVDNVPITIAMIPVLHGLFNVGVDVRALWWALVFGAGIGGNATIVGSTANLVIVEISERTATPITAGLWSRRGLPVTIVACTVVSILFALGYDFLVR